MWNKVLIGTCIIKMTDFLVYYIQYFTLYTNLSISDIM